MNILGNRLSAFMAGLFLIAASAHSPGARAADFVAYEGKDAIQEGQGGAKKTVDGIDFWSDGAPPRKFKLLGFITDTRLKTGLIGKMRMSGLESSIAKQAKSAGGDAVILISADTETKGYVGQQQTTGQATVTGYGNSATARGNTWSAGAAAAVQKQNTRYAVIQYALDEGLHSDDTAKESTLKGHD